MKLDSVTFVELHLLKLWLSVHPEGKDKTDTGHKSSPALPWPTG